MTRLVACPRCNVHVKLGAPRCPHCDVPLSRSWPSLSTTGALLLGLSLAGCTPSDPMPKPKPVDRKPQLEDEFGSEADAVYGLPENEGETGIVEPLPNAEPPAKKQPPPPEKKRRRPR